MQEFFCGFKMMYFKKSMASYQEYTLRSSIAPKRWVHKKRFKQAIKLLELKPDDTLLITGVVGDTFLSLQEKLSRQTGSMDSTHRNRCGNLPQKIWLAKPKYLPMLTS